MNRTIEDIQKDIELLGIKGGYDIEQLLTPQDCRRLSYEIERLKEELKYTIPIVEHNKTITKHLKEIERLTAESTKWESKFYDEAKKVDKAIEYIRQLEFESEELYDISEIARLELLDILKGSNKE